jgi:site-specific DNA recombinase
MTKVVKHADSEGDPMHNNAEAQIIRRVFREFAAGISPRNIARRLNDEGIPPPDSGGEL